MAEVKFFRGAHRFLPTLLKMEGYRVVEIPVGHNPRRAGHPHYGVWNRVFKTSADLLAVRWMKTRMIRYKIAETIN
jgi:dolichol-phosphate mannosyltransferase